MSEQAPSLYFDRRLLDAKRASARFLAVRAATEALAAPLSPEDMVVQSMPDASPTKWHLGHTTWFFETFILKPFAPGYREFDPGYDYLFNSYYEAAGARQPRAMRGLLTRPSLETVTAYRQHVTNAVAVWLAGNEGGDGWENGVQLLDLGCHHEEQHQELILTDIKHMLSQNPLKPAYYRGKAAKRTPAPALSWTAFDEGVREIGFAGPGFAYDCEGPRHKVYLQAFALASRPATNREFLGFVEDGGYERVDLWLSDGWAWVEENGARHPCYWRSQGKGWQEFTLAGEAALDPGAPASHLNYYEADAFARWSGARLPTEAEMEIGGGGPDQVWQWTSSAFAPYPGFRPAPGAVGEYNGKFMVSQYVLRGGSRATPKGHWRPTYRNFFYPWSRWQFTGVRLAKDL